jgi:hypothetical protein
VGPFAIDEGLVKAVEPITRVRIFNTNTKKVLVADVPVKDGKAVVEGDYHIDGVPGTGAKIALDFAGTGGTIRGTLLPTGKAKEKLHVDDIGDIQVSIVDAANPTVFAYAGDIGIKGTERFHDLLSNTEIWKKAELVRGAAAELLGFVKNRRNSAIESPAAPFSVFVVKSSDYLSYVTGDEIKAANVDLRGVLWASRQVSKAYAVTGTICTGAAAMIEGTIVNEILSGRAKETGVVRIGHPSGIIQVDVEVRKKDGDLQLTKATVFRTARRIMEGYVYLKPWTLKENEHTQPRSR